MSSFLLIFIFLAIVFHLHAFTPTRIRLIDPEPLSDTTKISTFYQYSDYGFGWTRVWNCSELVISSVKANCSASASDNYPFLALVAREYDERKVFFQFEYDSCEQLFNTQPDVLTRFWPSHVWIAARLVQGPNSKRNTAETPFCLDNKIFPKNLHRILMFDEAPAKDDTDQLGYTEEMLQDIQRKANDFGVAHLALDLTHLCATNFTMLIQYVKGKEVRIIHLDADQPMPDLIRVQQVQAVIHTAASKWEFWSSIENINGANQYTTSVVWHQKPSVIQDTIPNQQELQKYLYDVNYPMIFVQTRVARNSDHLVLFCGRRYLL